MLDRMTEFHDRIVAVALVAERHLTEDCPSIEDLGVARQQMARLITAYQLFVHREIFEPLIACGSVAEARQARLIKAECINLSEQYRAYTRQWAIEDMRMEWASYQPAALEFIVRIREQMANVGALAASLRMLQVSRSPIGSPMFGGRPWADQRLRPSAL